MNTTKLSLIAALTLSTAIAGGEIEPMKPTIKTVAPKAPLSTSCGAKAGTTVNGKLTGYFITDDTTDDMFGDHKQLAAALTLDVSHAFTDWLSANFSALGYVNAFNNTSDGTWGYFENNKNGALFNVANLTATYADTTLIVGRQLIDTPLVGGFDWLLAPGAFEGIVLANKSIENLTLIGGYLTKWRPNKSGDNWVDLRDIDDGNNYTVGAVYGANALKVSAWYYNVDSGAAAGRADKFKAVYADAGYDFGTFSVAGQIISTDYDVAKDSLAYGLKVATLFSGVDLSAAVSNTTDNKAGFVGRDSMYTSSWNYFASDAGVANDDTLSWKVDASTKLAGISLEASYAGYGDEGSELDLIAGYDATETIDVGAVYSLTDYDVSTDTQADATQQFEFFVNYKF